MIYYFTKVTQNNETSKNQIIYLNNYKLTYLLFNYFPSNLSAIALPKASHWSLVS